MDFQKTIGHEKQKTMFLRALKKNRMAHAYALIGPENVGKTTFALELAHILGADPVMDVMILDSEDDLTIKEVLEIRNRLSLTPAGKLKVAIVSNAERITLSAANALLKVLEEPPGQALLLLTVANPQRLLPTIASRVQKVFFRRSTDQDVKKILGTENLEKESLEKITGLAKGRIGLGLRMAQEKEFLEFYESALVFYDTLGKNKDRAERLLTAEKFSGLDTVDLKKVLRFAMLEWLEEVGDGRIAAKLVLTWKDLQANLNKKLSMDNLFLSTL